MTEIDGKYVLELSSRQARLIVKILDLYLRLGMGHWEVLAEELSILHDLDFPIHDDSNIVFRLLMEMKREVTGHSYGGSYGCAHPKVHVDAKVACELETVLRQVIARAENMQGTTWSHDPLRISGEPLASCQFVPTEDDECETS